MGDDPAVILADEPTGNLDQATGEEIVSLLADLARKQAKTVVVVTHDERLTESAQLRWYLEDGRLVDRLTRTRKKP